MHSVASQDHIGQTTLRLSWGIDVGAMLHQQVRDPQHIQTDSLLPSDLLDGGHGFLVGVGPLVEPQNHMGWYEENGRNHRSIHRVPNTPDATGIHAAPIDP